MHATRGNCRLRYLSGLIRVSLLLGVLMANGTATEAGKEYRNTCRIICSNSFGGAARDEGRTVFELADGSLLVGGSSRSFGPGDQDFWLVWTDSCGEEIQSCTHGESGYDPLAWAEPTSDGQFVACGAANMSSATGLYVVKLDASCNVICQYSYGNPSWGQVVHELSDGGFVAGGSGPVGLDGEMLLVRLDSNCALQWTASYGREGYNDELSDLAVTQDNGYILTGVSRPLEADTNSSNAYVVRTDSLGAVIWERAYGGFAGDAANYVVQTDDGCFVVTGRTERPAGGNSDLWLFKVCDLDSGAMIWEKTYCGESWSVGHAVAELADGRLCITGSTYGFEGTDDDSAALILMYTSASGDSLASLIYDGDYQDAGYHVQESSSGEVVLVAGVTSTAPGGDPSWDALVLRADACHCPHQDDFDEDGFVTAIDLAKLIDILFAGAPDIQDVCCPVPRGDDDCDGFTTAIDLAWKIDYLYAGGPHPCNPCEE